MVEHKDGVLAFLGASAGLAGLTLVFLGLVVSSFEGFERPVPDPIRSKYQNIAGFVVAAFGMGIACVGASGWWLIELRDQHPLYVATLVTFALELGLLCIATCRVLHRLLWKKA